MSLIHNNKATMVHFVPSMFSVFINFIKATDQAHLISSLRYVLASGEALKPELVNQFNEHIATKNNTLLLNFYGPTETTIDVTSFDCVVMYNMMLYQLVNRLLIHKRIS